MMNVHDLVEIWTVIFYFFSCEWTVAFWEVVPPHFKL